MADPLHLFQVFEDFLVFLARDPRHVPAKRASRDAAEHHSFHQQVDGGHKYVSDSADGRRGRASTAKR